MSDERPLTILCLASEFKGLPFIHAAKEAGCRVLLLAAEKTAQEAWPWDSIDERFFMPNISTQPDVTHAVSYLARGHKIDRIAALDDYDVATAASLREHMRLPGIGDSLARHFRDKLAMRVRARQAGLPVPDFAPILNYDDLRDFMARTPAPWVLKPRFDAGAIGIRKLHHSEELWRALDELGDKQSFYLVEQFIPGDVYHVDSLVWDNQVIFASPSKYGAPPLAVSHGGGIFSTRTLDPTDPETQALLALNRDLLTGLQLPRGASHSEFIRGLADGRFYFLETAARVGGANIDKLVQAATGVELWAEAARIEIAHARSQQYQLPPLRHDYAGLLICLSHQQRPDLSAYQEPEIVWRLPKDHHAGLIAVSPDPGRVEYLMGQYADRFAQDFLAVQPPKKEARTTF
ncbi:MAG: ATPase [Chloroflexi bacterium]|nr:ATPase [Chloroflexota bacterium]MBP7042258.1 ATPase [Chloroflexota bacterium]